MNNEVGYHSSDMLDTIGKRIKEAREEQGISQKDLGMSLGLSDKAVSAYEASRTIPPLETLVRIAEELHKPLEYFIMENSPDFKIETKIATMEITVSKLLQEIKTIREELGISPVEPE
jgi:transcriptional regulator with XRE-family HTH domain